MASVEVLLADAEACSSDDPAVTTLTEHCRALLGETEDVPSLRLLVVDFERSEQLRSNPIVGTDSCKVVLDPPTVLVSERFLLELEAAVRSFRLARSVLDCQYLRSDEELFGLAQRVRFDLPGTLDRLRRLDDPDAAETMVLTLFFFVAHEVGHLLDEADERGYATFIQADAPLETQVANAAMKLCRHVDEFAKHQFGLPAFERTADPEDEIRLRERELTSTPDLAPLKKRHERFFRDELSADDTAIRLLVQHLARVEETQGAAAAMRVAALAIGGLFAASLFTWYRDLLTFGEKLGTDGPPDAPTLIAKMLEGRETYIHAASLFGYEHRFTLLRSALAAEAILRTRTNYFEIEDRTIWWTKPEPNGNPWWREPPDEAWWATEALKRYWMLCILLDTAVKIAYMGCSTAWLLEADRARGSPQLFMMNFEPVSAAVARLEAFK